MLVSDRCIVCNIVSIKSCYSLRFSHAHMHAPGACILHMYVHIHLHTIRTYTYRQHRFFEVIRGKIGPILWIVCLFKAVIRKQIRPTRRAVKVR